MSALQDDETTYYRVRAEDPSDLTQFERGVRFVYLNRYCFNGLYRTNCRGQFNVPYGRSRTGALPPVEQFLACARLLARAELRAWDFGTALRYVQEGDFVYLDPPYAVRTRRVFREYGPKSFSSGDLERLAWHLEKLDAKGARFLLSYAYCGDAKRLFDRWRVTRDTTRRHIAGFAGARRNTYEMLVTNA